MKKNLSMLLALLLLGFGAVACGEDDDDDNNNDNNNDECEVDDDCDDDEICDDGECVEDEDEEPECEVDDDCDGDDVCNDDGECEAPPECVEDADCEEGEVCDGGECVVPGDECEADEDCEEGEVCNAGVCEDAGGDECNEYCALALDTCLDVIGAEALGFEDEETCQAACEDFNAIGERDDRGGDSVFCRIYHAEVASNVAPEFHCPHASTGGGGVCEDDPPGLCDTYCGIMIENCPDTFGADVEDIAGCVTDCEAAALEDGNLGDAVGNTLQCRIFHAALALDDQAECVEADLNDTAVCVDE